MSASARGRGAKVRPHLRFQDKLDELVTIDPVQLANDGQRGKIPPRVADIFKLLRTSIQTTIGQLTLAQEPPQQLSVDTVELAQNRESSHADPHCSSQEAAHSNKQRLSLTLSTVTLRSRLGTEGAIKVHTADNVVDDKLTSLASVDGGKSVQASQK